MSDEFLRAMVRERGRLAQAVWAFNFACAGDIHPRRVPEGAAGAVLRRILVSRLGARRLSANVAWSVGGENPPPCFGEFEEPRLRVALLPRDLLEAMTLRLGAALLHGRICRSIAREEVLALRAGLGAAHVEFAMRGAALLLSAEGWARLPAVGEGPPLEAEVREAGLRGLWACVRDAPAGLLVRLRLKLPPEADDLFPPGAAYEQAREVLWALLRRIVLREAEREWAALLS